MTHPYILRASAPSSVGFTPPDFCAEASLVCRVKINGMSPRIIEAAIDRDGLRGFHIAEATVQLDTFDDLGDYEFGWKYQNAFIPLCLS